MNSTACVKDATSAPVVLFLFPDNYVFLVWLSVGITFVSPPRSECELCAARGSNGTFALERCPELGYPFAHPYIYRGIYFRNLLSLLGNNKSDNTNDSSTFLLFMHLLSLPYRMSFAFFFSIRVCESTVSRDEIVNKRVRVNGTALLINDFISAFGGYRFIWVSQPLACPCTNWNTQSDGERFRVE
ncbi:hypothetical protein CEXT_354951 [Caerostris extrusa]|uniref:Uncharacterized protein n=1 Tax=Caerostris extrusa TaxID=172846 RepID=A0AAV4UQ68_CAEEX|nr:hypothetical protein CEXT_354951 [Caerostris extrusa]